MKTATETKTETREYTIPLRKEWRKVANYRRAGRAAKHIKKFIARHMKVPERDLSKVKLDMYLNNEIWFRGKTKPPAKIKVKVIKEDDIVKVYLAETPEVHKFAKQKHEKRHKEAEQPKEAPKEEKPKEEDLGSSQGADESRGRASKSESGKSQEEKKDEKEKEKSAAISKEKVAETQAKAQKHTIQKKEPSYHRTALKK
jgi:large subunit ribosomal protein L31e